LHLTTNRTSFSLGHNRLGEGGGRALAETLRLNTTLPRSTFGGMA